MAKTAFSHKFSFRYCKFQAATIISDSCNLYAGLSSLINTGICNTEEYLIKPQNISGSIIWTVSYTSLRRGSKSFTIPWTEKIKLSNIENLI